MITSPTSPVHAVVLLVYRIVFYVAGRYRSRPNLSLLDDLPYILAASVVGFAIELALISLFPHVDPPGQQVVHAVALLGVVLVVRRIAYTVVRRARLHGKVRHRTLTGHGGPAPGRGGSERQVRAVGDPAADVRRGPPGGVRPLTIASTVLGAASSRNQLPAARGAA